VNTVSGVKDTGTVASEDYNFIIENLDACVEYVVSVTAVNADDVGDKTATRRVTTKATGNCHTHIILLYL
jgi:hypothetical protein